jgi:hypothetical protein
MRVIRTDTFFDRPEIGFDVSPLAKSISTAWFKNEEGELFGVEPLLLPGYSSVKSDDQGVHRFLIHALGYGAIGSNIDPAIFERARWITGNDVTKALSIEVVIEQSPPITLPLSKLLSKAPGVAIGTFIGYQIGAESPAIMLLSVPGGILAVSSAIGIAKALERGLHNKVEALFKNKPKQARSAD